MAFFQYSDEAKEYLRKNDQRLAEVIDQVGPIEREIIPDLFEALVNSIIGQQISMKAAATVWRNMKIRFGSITPERILEESLEDLQSCGISMRKAVYIREAAEKVISGDLPIEQLRLMDDQEVIEELTKLKGIGVWTAEMLLIFSMQRQDVLSFDDFAIHRGLRMVYHHRRIDRKRFDKYRRRYSPYATLAALYLWEVASGSVPGMKDHAPLSDAEKKRKSRQKARTRQIGKQS